jgi:TonB family protein
MTTLLLVLCLPCALLAQQPPPPPAAPPAPSVPAPPKVPQELGKWWKNSEIVKKLQITEAQVKQIEQVFLDHRLKLVDLRAELERRELQMKPLLEVDRPDESKVVAQTQRIAEARGELEKANTLMMLAIRRILSVEQWKGLEEIREARRLPAPPAPPAPPPPPPPPKIGPESGRSDDEVYHIGAGVKPPVVVRQPLPYYTPEAREAKIEGTLLLQLIVRKNGTVDNLKVIRSLGYGLDEAAMDTITKEWQFKPGTLNGRPVDVQANVEVSFRLK